MIDKISAGNKKEDTASVTFDSEEERMILAAAIGQSSVAVLITDILGDIIYMNPALEEMTGYTQKELMGKNPRILKSGLTKPEVYVKMWKTISNGGIWNGEQINVRKDGSLYHEDSRITPIYNKNNKLTYYLAVKHDISERKKLEEKLKEAAIRDSLTNAYNRSYLFDRLNQISDNYKRVGKAFSIAMLDIDSFKKINDTYGHQIGDHVLIEFVRLINENIRSYDILARYGGEEFIVVLPDTDKKDAYNIFKRILKITMGKTFNYDSENIKIAFSAGIADANEIGKKNLDIQDLIGIADKRLYTAKRTGKSKIVI